MGLDPPTLTTLSPLLYRLAQKRSPRLLLALRQQDPVPDWITHLIYLGPSLRICGQGVKADVLRDLGEQIEKAESLDTTHRPAHLPRSMAEIGRGLTPTGIHNRGLESLPDYEQLTKEQIANLKKANLYRPEYRDMKARYEGGERSYFVQRTLLFAPNGLEPYKGYFPSYYSMEGFLPKDREPPVIGEALVEMSGVTVKYGDKKVLGDWTQVIDGQLKEGMWWQICRGQRWGVFGPNGRLPSLGI